MKFNIPLFPFLFAVYPLFALMARNPGEIVPTMALRFTLILCALTLAVIWLLHALTRDWVRSVLLGTLAIWFFSSSGHVYRLMVDYAFASASAWLHPVIILVFFGLLVFLAQKRVWTLLKAERWWKTVFGYLNLLGGLSLVLAIWPIMQFWMKAYDDTPRPWAESFAPQTVTLTAPSSPPDIYYIILDGYGRQDALADVYGYDNSEFVEFLSSRGFYVADEARSNYVQTPLSLSSSLNFDYINFAEEYAGADSINRIPLFDLLKDSRTVQLLRDQGYRVVATSSGYPFTEFLDADEYLSPYRPSLNELERFFLSTTALDAVISTDTKIGDSLRTYLPLPGYQASRERIIFSLEELQTIPRLAGPKFVFVHIVGPHPPFVIDRNGDPVHTDRPYLAGDGMAFGGTPEEYQRDYIEQLTYINRQMELAIDAILAGSSQPPIILIQGDHGPGSMLMRDSLEQTCLFERTSILSAYYIPNGSEWLSAYLTPVNSFRVVFNAVFDAGLPLLANETYFSPQSWPYDFTPVSDQIETTCKK
ncbi:MAG: sulfatase-like hydrolase/transferase [Chloroflexota bacterium]